MFRIIRYLFIIAICMGILWFFEGGGNNKNIPPSPGAHIGSSLDKTFSEGATSVKDAGKTFDKAVKQGKKLVDTAEDIADQMEKAGKSTEKVWDKMEKAGKDAGKAMEGVSKAGEKFSSKAGDSFSNVAEGLPNLFSESASSKGNSDRANSQKNAKPFPEKTYSLKNIPPYSGTPFVKINRNRPFFTELEKKSGDFETYSRLDRLGRCGVAFARIGRNTMPTEKRGNISAVHPSGWRQHRYSSKLVDGGHLYNRCHLIGFQLAGENANPRNLITGTRYLNVDGMLPFENQIADYVKRTNGHVLYRVTPLYNGNDLVARGVLMEAWSQKDNGRLHFNVFCYNVQPGIVINYKNGQNRLKKAS